MRRKTNLHRQSQEARQQMQGWGVGVTAPLLHISKIYSLFSAEIKCVHGGAFELGMLKEKLWNSTH